MNVVRELMGGCQCGALRYRLSSEPLAMIRCHCTNCQSQSASAFGISVYAAVESFRLSGEARQFEARADSGRMMRYHFCPECGTRTHHTKPPDPAIVSIKGGSLDPGHGLEPVADLWTQSKLSWVSLLQDGLAFDGQPPDMEAVYEHFRSRRTIAVYDTRAGDYADMVARTPERPILDAFLAQLPEGGSVLDLGCGSGWAAAAFREAGMAVTAIDASAGLAREARIRHGIEVETGRIETFRAEAVYDGIWVHFSLLHTPRRVWPSVLVRLHAALKPDGLLHLGIKAGEGAAMDRLGRFYSYATRPELTALLNSAGFENIAVEQRPGGKGFDGVESEILLAGARRAG